MMGRGLERLAEVPAGNVAAFGGLGTAILKSATLSSTPCCRPLAPMMFPGKLAHEWPPNVQQQGGLSSSSTLKCRQRFVLPTHAHQAVVGSAWQSLCRQCLAKLNAVPWQHVCKVECCCRAGCSHCEGCCRASQPWTDAPADGRAAPAEHGRPLCGDCSAGVRRACPWGCRSVQCPCMPHNSVKEGLLSTFALPQVDVKDGLHTSTASATAVTAAVSVLSGLHLFQLPSLLVVSVPATGHDGRAGHLAALSHLRKRQIRLASCTQSGPDCTQHGTY